MGTVTIALVTILSTSRVFWTHHITAFVILLRALHSKVALAGIIVREVIVASTWMVLSRSLLHLELMCLVAASVHRR